MVIILVAIIVLLLIGLAILSMILFRRARPTPDQSQTSLMLKADISELTKSISELKDGMTKQLNDQLITSNRQMANQFAESSKIISEVTRNLTELKESNRQVMGITDELKVLQKVLSNPKQRGVLGEYYLASVLENVLPPGQFSLQYRFKNGDIVDAVINLDKKRILPIDSKFSLENYNLLSEETDKLRRLVLAKAFKEDLKKRIDETAKYIRPQENTLDYAFMFIPSEAIYYDLLANKVGLTNTTARDLIEYAFRDKHVIIVSPTTLMAYLQTVLQGLRSLQIEEQAKEIQERVGDLGRHLDNFETFMQKLGNSLGTTVGHFNTAHKELKKVDKDVVKIAGSAAAVDPLVLDKPTPDED
ncbi:MAG TPA: DNA recombination protein RmuC [Candidatus Saccharimonadales bacterium]|nr:DNA recombination protein RmuC [Candidatus Saccharimonadales bacterium]